ncbi:MAG TPA: hypothetical protein VK553_08545, partial [Candidatus Nitrosopolaris rasttigaisensis]|nr:hypothetical protein [Candidatus Nitrosopolaris rasttigaisensis]
MGAIALLRGKWNEATRIQRTIVASTQELGNTQKEVEKLGQVLEKLKEKNRTEQKEILLEEKGVLQKYGDTQALVQKPVTKFQQKWFAEQSKLIERYKEIRKFLSQEREDFTETTMRIFNKLGAKFDINALYHSLPSYEINTKKILEESGNRAKHLLKHYEEKQRLDKSKDQQTILNKILEKLSPQLSKVVHTYPDLCKIKRDNLKYHARLEFFESAINSESESREDKKQFRDYYSDYCNLRSSEDYNDAETQLRELCKIGESIDKHVRLQEDLRSSVRMLEKSIADTKHYQDGDRERIEEDYKEFIKNYGISREEVKGNKSKETMEKQLRGFEEAHDLYQALIDGKKNNVSNEDMKVIIDGKINKAEIRKEAVKCYLLAIEKEDRGPIYEYMRTMEKEKMKEVMSDHEFKNIISLFKLLNEEKSCYNEIRDLIPFRQEEAAKSTQKKAEEEEKIYRKQPKTKEGYQDLVTGIAKGWYLELEQVVQSDLLFEKIIRVCESWQNEFSNALEKLVSQEEERIASKQGEIEGLQISLQELRIEASDDMKAFIRESQKKAERKTSLEKLGFEGSQISSRIFTEAELEPTSLLTLLQLGAQLPP